MARYQNKRAKTKALIIKSVLALAHRKGLLNVSVSNIVKFAHINRKTFYRYFTDQPTLIEAIEIHVIQNIKQAHAKLYQFNKLDMIFKQNNPRRELFHFLDTFGKNRHVILLLTGKHGDPMFNYRFQKLIRQMLINTQSHFSINLSHKNQQLFIHYFASGIYGLILFWLHHYHKYSKGDLFQFIYKTNKEIIRKFSE